MPYSAVFNDYLAHPRNAGELSGATHVAEATNPACGDRLRLALLINDNRIHNAQFLAYGCPPTIVCGSALTELIKGKLVADALAITRKQVVEAVGGLPSRKQHSAALAIETLHSALENETELRIGDAHRR